MEYIYILFTCSNEHLHFKQGLPEYTSKKIEQFSLKIIPNSCNASKNEYLNVSPDI